MTTLDLYKGPFLPRSETEWATGERDALQLWIVRVGLETMDEWYRTGEFGKCETLAERLLQIDRFDVALNEFLIRVMIELRGVVSARATALEVRLRFEREFGTCPPSVLRLERELTEAV